LSSERSPRAGIRSGDGLAELKAKARFRQIDRGTIRFLPRSVAYNASMANRKSLGGIIHTYQKYDPVNLPAPTQPPPDLVSPALEHFLMFGSARELSDEELARAVRLDPSQIAGLGPSLDALLAMLLERKRKILEKYETQSVQGTARKEFQKAAGKVEPPPKLRDRFKQAVQ